MSELNKHVLLVMKWLDDKGSISQDELIENRKAAAAATAAAYTAAAATAAAYTAAYAAYAAYTAAYADAEKLVDKYFERTGENKQDYIDAIEAGKVSSKKEPAQEWDGEGLPPVGTVCEAELSGDGFVKCLVMGYFDDLVWINWHFDTEPFFGNPGTQPASQLSFRPLKSQEQKDREAFKLSVSQAILDAELSGSDRIGKIANALFDAGFKAPEGE